MTFGKSACECLFDADVHPMDKKLIHHCLLTEQKLLTSGFVTFDGFIFHERCGISCQIEALFV